MAKPQEKAKSEIISLGVPLRGLTSANAHVTGKDFAKTMHNLIFHPEGISTPLGWKTVTNGFEEGNGSFVDGQSYGFNSANFVKHVGYVKNDHGKVIAFQKSAMADTSTGVQFADSTSFTTARRDSKDWIGCLYFADRFFLYNELKLYSINEPFDGTVNQEVDFTVDLGAEYSPIVKIIVRYGQLWVISKEDRIFWSDVAEYSVGAGASKSVTIDKKWNVWQELRLNNQELSAVNSVTGNSYNEVVCKTVNAFAVQAATAYLFMDAPISGFTAGDKIKIKETGEEREIASAPSGVEQVAVKVNSNNTYGNGDLILDIDLNMDGVDKAFWMYNRSAGRPEIPIVITEAAKGTTTTTIKTFKLYGTFFRIWLTSPLQDDYTTAALVTATDSIKLSFTSDWDVSRRSCIAMVEVETVLTLNTDYEVSLTPADDADADGHIKLLETVLVKAQESIVVDYTPFENDFNSDTAGWIDIDKNSGNNIAVAIGPGGDEVEGSSIFYIFKDNGGIYALTGRPGLYNTLGSLDVTYLAGGIFVRPNSLQTTRDGVYFGAINGVDYNVYFIPHGKRFIDSVSVPHLNEHYDFNEDIPFDDDTYTIFEQTGIFNGSHYMISFTWAVDNDTMPESDGNIYLCEPYKDGDRMKGRWSTLPESTETEYAAGLAVGTTVPDGGAPTVLGFYYHDKKLYKVYFLKTNHDFSGPTRFYEIASYGWYDGGEECKSKYVFTNLTGPSTYASEYSTDYFEATIEWGWIRFYDMHHLFRLLIDLDLRSAAAKIDLYMYKDFKPAPLAGYPKQFTALTDDPAALKVFNEYRDIKFQCKYFKPKIVFKNIDYRNRPAKAVLRNLAFEMQQLTDKGLLDEEVV